MSVTYDYKKIQDILSPLFIKFSKHVGFQNPNTIPPIDLYHKKIGKNTYFYTMKMIRNISTVDRFKSLNRRLHSLYMSMEYFNDNVSIKRIKGDQWNKEFLELIMTSMMVDTIRSVLDIYSISVMTYFGNQSSENVNFSWKRFIKPIKYYSTKIHKESNKLYQSSEYQFLQKFRTSEKHLGFTSSNIKIDSDKIRNTVNIKISRNPPVYVRDVRDQSMSTVNRFLTLMKVTISEMCSYKLGYDSKDDINSILNPDGTWSIPN